MSVGALMLSMGGWDKLARSATPGEMTRSFFGVYSIGPAGDDARMLVHGTTVHGIQNLGSPERERMATSYYAPASGVGIALTAAPACTAMQRASVSSASGPARSPAMPGPGSIGRSTRSIR